jgi:hypothetical protein
MADKTWKRAEREIARRLGGRRVPVTGRQRGDAPDVTHKNLSIEVKHRKALPAWLLDAMDQANASRSPGQVAIAVLHASGSQYDQSLVLMELEPFSRLLAVENGTDAAVAGLEPNQVPGQT